ncbi:MAG: hypothetical protein IPJ04_05295 [Candidatus Eisenbacteria bacterium]|nr:hypothetical protein [Candidatus Eisenbacteria bacterium]
MKLRRAIALFQLLALLAPAAAGAATKLEGEYQVMLELRKTANNRNFRWDWNSNEWDTYNNAQLRMFSTPRAGVETFAKFEAAYRPSGENDGARPEFKYREMHVRFRKQLGKREWDNYLFSRQDRFWSEPYQVQIFDNGQHGFRLDPLLYGRGDWQGVRSEFKGQHGFNLTFVAGDRSNQVDPGNFGSFYPYSPTDSINHAHALRTDDLYLFRVRRDFLKEARLKLGFLLTRSENWKSADSLGPDRALPRAGPGHLGRRRPSARDGLRPELPVRGGLSALRVRQRHAL